MNWKDLAFYIFKKNLIFKIFNYFNVLILKKIKNKKKYYYNIFKKQLLSSNTIKKNCATTI
jgi:hypothetical protein